MSIDSGASVYNAISSTPSVSWGSLASDAQKVKDFFRNRRTQRAMDDNKDALGDALSKSDYAKAAEIATKAGDFERADNYAALANDLEQQKSNAAYQNALIGLKRDEVTAERADKAVSAHKEMQSDEIARNAAEQALWDLHQLGVDGKITKWNNETGGVFANSSGGGERIGKRQAALAALLPYTNLAAKKSGGSGINTLGEMMAYLGMPENATSAEIIGALPGIARKLGMESLFNGVPEKGAVEDGYVYLGGDPQDPNNWREVQ